MSQGKKNNSNPSISSGFRDDEELNWGLLEETPPDPLVNLWDPSFDASEPRNAALLSQLAQVLGLSESQLLGLDDQTNARQQIGQVPQMNVGIVPTLSNIQSQANSGQLPSVARRVNRQNYPVQTPPFVGHLSSNSQLPWLQNNMIAGVPRIPSDALPQVPTLLSGPAPLQGYGGIPLSATTRFRRQHLDIFPTPPVPLNGNNRALARASSLPPQGTPVSLNPPPPPPSVPMVPMNQISHSDMQTRQNSGGPSVHPGIPRSNSLPIMSTSAPATPTWTFVTMTGQKKNKPVQKGHSGSSGSTQQEKGKRKASSQPPGSRKRKQAARDDNEAPQKMRRVSSAQSQVPVPFLAHSEVADSPSALGYVDPDPINHRPSPALPSGSTPAPPSPIPAASVSAPSPPALEYVDPDPVEAEPQYQQPSSTAAAAVIDNDENELYDPATMPMWTDEINQLAVPPLSESALYLISDESEPRSPPANFEFPRNSSTDYLTISSQAEASAGVVSLMSAGQSGETVTVTDNVHSDGPQSTDADALSPASEVASEEVYDRIFSDYIAWPDEDGQDGGFRAS